MFFITYLVILNLYFVLVQMILSVSTTINHLADSILEEIIILPFLKIRFILNQLLILLRILDSLIC